MKCTSILFEAVFGHNAVYVLPLNTIEYLINLI